MSSPESIISCGYLSKYTLKTVSKAAQKNLAKVWRSFYYVIIYSRYYFFLSLFCAEKTFVLTVF